MKNLFKNFFLLTIFLTIFISFVFLAQLIAQLNDPEKQLQSLLLNCDQTITKALFSPDDDVRSILIKLIETEKKKIMTAIYTITDKEISQALINAQDKGVIVQIIVDRGYGADRYSRVPQLANSKIPIWVYQTDQDERNSSLMHNKFCIFEDNICNKSILWTGSYNFTNRANSRNQENVIILDNKNLIELFIKQFEKIKERSLLISGKPGENYRFGEQEAQNSSWWDSVCGALGF